MRGRVSSLLEVGTGFHPDLTGRDNIYMNGGILGMRQREVVQKFDEIVAFSEMDNFIDTPVKRYSSGMRIRLAFSIAVHLLADIVILDEVLAVGDTFFKQKCLKKMNEMLLNEGRTLLFVSHSMSNVKKLCHRGLLLDRGRLLFDGAINQAFNTYLHHSQSPKEKASA
jgi:lipopolysaccharide transport system ATP-binding protein